MKKRKIVAIVNSWYSVFCLKMLKNSLFQNDSIDLIVTSQILADKAKKNDSFDRILVSETYPKNSIKRLLKSSRQNYLDFFQNYFKQEKPDIVFFYNLTSEKYNILSYVVRTTLPKSEICILVEGFSQLRQKIFLRTKLELAFKNFYCKHILRLNCYKQGKHISGLDKIDDEGKDLVTSAYIPAKFPHTLPEDKVVYFNYAADISKHKKEQKPSKPIKSALIMSQYLVDIGFLSLEDSKKNSEFLVQYLKDHGVEKIYLKSHPGKSKHDDFTHPEIINIDIPEDEFIDEHVLKEDYAFVISYYSAAIFSSAFNDNPNKKFISLGFQDLKKISQKDIDNHLKLFSHIGIDVIDPKSYQLSNSHLKKSA